MKATCERCGASIEQVYSYNGKSYGSTCIKIVLQEAGIKSTKIGSGCFDQKIVLRCAELYREFSQPPYPRQPKKEIYKVLGSTGFIILAAIIKGTAIRLDQEGIEIYQTFRKWLKEI